MARSRSLCPLWVLICRGELQLIDKIEKETHLTSEDRQALIYILQSIKRSPENINYLIISLFSLVAIAIDQLIVYLGGF